MTSKYDELSSAATPRPWVCRRVSVFSSRYGGYVHYLNDDNGDASSYTCHNRITATTENAAFITTLANHADDFRALWEAAEMCRTTTGREFNLAHRRLYKAVEALLPLFGDRE